MEHKNKRYNDIRLIFHEEEHKYNDSLGNDYISTTTILHNYAPKFDKNYWLRKKSKELGISEKKLEELSLQHEKLQKLYPHTNELFSLKSVNKHQI